MMLLAVCAVAYGALAALLFRRLTDGARLRVTANQVLAHVMEFRLFLDEPALIWRAQKAALRANLGVLRQIALPVLLASVPLVLGWGAMQRRFGQAPLRVGETTVMTAHSDNVPCFTGLLVETPGVHIPRTGEVVWRVRLARELREPLPSGVELLRRRSYAWIAWFFAISTVSAVVVSRRGWQRN